MRPGDADVRQPLREDLDGTFVVEAAAGTGKTTVLVSRIVAVLRAGRARMSQLVAVTFTEKAAGEMKLRLRVALEREREALTDAIARQRLADALEALEVARIGTIHGLCADLLREYPIEAGVDPRFEVATGADADALLESAFAQQLDALLASPPEGIRRAVRRRGDRSSARLRLLGAVRQLAEHRDFDAPWRRDPFDREAGIDAVVEVLRAFAPHAARLRPSSSGGPLGDCLAAVHAFVDDTAHLEAVAARDYDGLEAKLHDLAADNRHWEWNDWQSRFEGVSSETVLQERARVLEHLRAFNALADADLAACLREELWPVVLAYEAAKARTGALDFLDLLVKTRDLVRDAPAVRAALQLRFTHLFVDEFQDTDPLQTELLLLLASDDAACADAFAGRPVPGKLFVVGDPRQSIYRFRRADVTLYQRVKAHLEAHGARVVHLTTSFRGTPGIQAAINGAFEQVMRAGHGQHPDYVHLGQWRPALASQPSVIALSPSRVFGGARTPTKKAVRQSLPDTVGAFIAWLVRESGWTVEEGGRRVPIEPRHVCVLFKRLRSGAVDVPLPWAQALEAREVPHVLVGGHGFHGREEVLALRTALAAIERPDDELSVYATLHGPFFALSDEQLLCFRQEAGRFHPLRPLEDVTLSDAASAVREALTVLRELHFNRNRRPAAHTVGAFLEATRAHAGLALWNAGAQVLANVLQLGEVTRRLERRATSFRAVVERLETQADEGVAPEAPILEEGTEGVRMMTVHAAKGLEFPVVILAEPADAATSREPSHWADPERRLWVYPLFGCQPSELRQHGDEARARDAEEAVRVTYVAATRARDLLVVPAVGDAKRWSDGWTEVLSPSLMPVPDAAAHPAPAPGCPELGNDIVTDRDGDVPDTVPRPGLHRASTGKNGVVWWGPRPLRLGLEAHGGLQHTAPLEDAAGVGAESQSAWEAWREERQHATERGAVPFERVRTARELEAPPEGAPVSIEDTGIDRSTRPGGTRFGALVHATLATVPLDATAEMVRRVASVQARALWANDEEVGSAVDAVVAALAHPCLSAARQARVVRRECELLDMPDDGDFIEGSADLAYLDDAGWTVLEFKTDEALDEHRAAYEAQTASYVRAIAAASRLPARGVLLRV